ncbi:PAS domain-containing protein [Luteithermobacter gelatinilyticus]|uniref:PAS domain-containing protein n=1 Tax=Luteithermobacter gelatinilyticus TaxID=2582913 RepID=UPI001105DE63|nr:PAS domain-containing protein [Luteithermobacter gelatinilyticus]
MFLSDFDSEDIPVRPLRELYDYWCSKCAGRRMPVRADIRPAEIPHLLPHISLIDVEEHPRRFRVRLVGTETVRAMGEDVTGKYTDTLKNFAPVHDRYLWLIDNKKPYFSRQKLEWSPKNFMDYYALGLPLSKNGEDVNIIMFGMYYFLPEPV